MENATKALLIAAAVLVAILIISLGLVIYNMASETIDSLNFSGQEVMAFNKKFTQYEGERVRGTEINAMLKTVLNSNMQSRAEGLTPALGQKFVEVTGFGISPNYDNSSRIQLSFDATSLSGVQANPTKFYRVQLLYNESTGFVERILILDVQ